MFHYNDGGRKAAGFQGMTGDCGCRAIAIAMQRDYAEVYKDLNDFCKWYEGRKRGRLGRAAATGRGSSARTGIFGETMRAYMENCGWVWVPAMKVGQGCKVHLVKHELPPGRIVASVSKHYVAVVDGVPHDTFDPGRGGSRCVYGYWKAPELHT